MMLLSTLIFIYLFIFKKFNKKLKKWADPFRREGFMRSHKHTHTSSTYHFMNAVYY